MTIEERANQAAQWKATGIYNCAQAVTQAFADQIPVEAETLKKLGAGYAAGMGCMEATCGALIGAVMAAGILTDGKGTPAVSRQLVAGFQEKCGATICKDLRTADRRYFQKAQAAGRRPKAGRGTGKADLQNL